MRTVTEIIHGIAIQINEIVASDDLACQVGVGQVHAGVYDGDYLAGGAGGNIPGCASLDIRQRVLRRRIGIVYGCVGRLDDIIRFDKCDVRGQF